MKYRVPCAERDNAHLILSAHSGEYDELSEVEAYIEKLEAVAEAGWAFWGATPYVESLRSSITIERLEALYNVLCAVSDDPDDQPFYHTRALLEAMDKGQKEGCLKNDNLLL